MFKRSFHLPLDKNDSLFVFGPRGTGKTSWLKYHIPRDELLYIDLLDGLTFRSLISRPESLRELIPNDFSGWVVIDEVQKIPALLDEVHRLIESKKYRFILTGSSARKLKKSGTNLLAGRAIHYTMHPLIIEELENEFNLKTALQFGLLPAIYSSQDKVGYLATYVETYLREEVMQEGLTRNISAFSRFLEVASFSQGQIINASTIAREVAVDRQVIQNYFSILYDLLLAHTLPAFTKRAKRRLITTEKFYYFDAGVYHQLRPKGLLDTQSEMAGPGLETLFYQSALALIAYHRASCTLFYWRTVNGVEVDFILYGEKKLVAVEIKHSTYIDSSMLTGLKHFKEDYPMAKCFLLYLGHETRYLSYEITIMPFVDGLKMITQWVQ
ncbi:MAG: ATPase [Legionellales bacterium RIFCSPHIGHO2_12_FULL_37_14]|nr:MAG: ATPase [Legionellales bacterium RIFCSPHIGHO2_12_FULL_37_14]